MTEKLCKECGKLTKSESSWRRRVQRCTQKAVAVIKEAIKENEESMDEDSESEESDSSEIDMPQDDLAPVADEYAENARGLEEHRKRQKLSK